ncbi:MAG TPA: HD domain-containing phosphohydrolase [Spirochaetota bacterium]|nr:HD domain-containing phosphohydrolase [Spirochaetota bacterium]
MNAIKDYHLDQFNNEIREMMHRRIMVIMWVAVILMPMFSFLDYFAAREYAELFFVYRMGCSAAFLALLFIYRWKNGRRHPYRYAVMGYLVSGATISAMCVKQGGYGSFYYAGLIMVLIAFTAILPLDAMQAVRAGLVMLLIYCAPIFIFNTPTPESLRVFYSNMFFFIFFIAIVVVKCNVDTSALKREFNLRMELDSASERLSYYAHNLEKEVEKRARALEESELRYRDLYDNIIDMLVLVNNTNNIQMANPRFYEWMGVHDAGLTVIPLISILHPDDVTLIRDRMRVRLIEEGAVRDFQFRIVNHTGEVMDVECNAHVINKDGGIIGFQMVMRDITVRKRLERDLLDSYRHAQNARAATIIGLAKLAEYRDEDTGTHLERIREYARMIAEELSKKPDYSGYITPEYIEDIYISSILHDIGKVGVPDSILLKPGRLDSDEFEIIKRHTTFGGDALRAVESQIDGISFLTLGKEIAYYHHERWDGTGYPEGLAGEDIPLSARIVAIADVYDALTSRRIYKEAIPHEKALEIIVSDRGRYFAPDIVDAFLAREREFRRIREELIG